MENSCCFWTGLVSSYAGRLLRAHHWKNFIVLKRVAVAAVVVWVAVHPWKLTWQWKRTIFNRRYIFIHGCFSIFTLVFGGVVLVVVIVIMVVEVVATAPLTWPQFPAAYLQFFAPAPAVEAESTALHVGSRSSRTWSSQLNTGGISEFQLWHSTLSSQIEINSLPLPIHILHLNLVGFFSQKRTPELFKFAFMGI